MEVKEISNFKKIAKSFIPPIFLEITRKLRFSDEGWQGNYRSWHEAAQDSDGYSDQKIFNLVKQAAMMVKNGEAVYERDGIIFDRIQYSWPALSGILLAAARNGGNLNVIDFGGGLGSSYFQNRKFLNYINLHSWNVVEQKHFVEFGNKHFADEKLSFSISIEECLKASAPDTFLLSGVVQYLESPFELLKRIAGIKLNLLIIDRTTFINGSKTRIAIQKVSKLISGASYPIWLFNEKEFLKELDRCGFKVLEDFFEYPDYGDDVYSKGFILEKKV